jgi:hypothetical protein
MVLRKMVHENYHTNTEGEPVNDIAVFRVRICAGCTTVIIGIILSDNCRLPLPAGPSYRTKAGQSTDLTDVRWSGSGKAT